MSFYTMTQPDICRFNLVSHFPVASTLLSCVLLSGCFARPPVTANAPPVWLTGEVRHAPLEKCVAQIPMQVAETAATVDLSRNGFAFYDSGHSPPAIAFETHPGWHLQQNGSWPFETHHFCQPRSDAVQPGSSLFAEILLPPQHPDSVLREIASDYQNMFSPGSLLQLGGGLGLGAALAESSADEHIRNYYQVDVRSGFTDELSSRVKVFGEGKYVIPTALGAWAVGHWLDGRQEGGIGEWGERSSRTLLVGGPLLLGMQAATGGSRPGESPSGSSWQPFKDANGASGHAFVGAVPFLSLADMTDDQLAKTTLIGLSTLPALSRVNDDAHYLSQAVLGWGAAFLASNAVDRSFRWQHLDVQCVPMTVPGATGFGFQWTY